MAKTLDIWAVFASIVVAIGMSFVLFGIWDKGLIFRVLVIVFGLTLVVVAWKTNGSQRAAAGTPFLIILLVIAVFAQPSEFGQAAFGARWPAIQEKLTNAFAPLLLSSKALFKTYQTGFTCLVDPIGCQRAFEPQTQAEGQVRTVEFLSVDTAGSTQIQSVCEQRPVFLTVKNNGDRTANNVRIVASAPLDIDQKTEDVDGDGKDDGTIVGTMKIITCGKGNAVGDDTCEVDRLFPGESVQVGINYNLDLTSEEREPRGHRIQLKGTILYDFDVNASLDVVIANSTFYDRLSSQGQLIRNVVPTRDTGGPVRLGLAVFNNEMPIRGGVEATPILLTLSDQGIGFSYINDIKLAQIDASGIAKTEAEGMCTLNDGLDRLEGEIDALEKSGIADQNVRDTCIVPLKDPQEQETQTSSVTGFVRYEYAYEGWTNVFVAYGAGDSCLCDNGKTVTGNPANIAESLSYEESCRQSCEDPKVGSTWSGKKCEFD